MVGDGQVSLGNTVVKPNAQKVRAISDGKVLVGFAGSTADAFTLLERLEGKLEEHPGQLMRSCVELAKAWRTDKYLRHLEALLIACDKDVSLTLTGNGNVVQPHDGIIGIGSGGDYAVSAARALIDIPELSAEEVAMKSMNIAADICVFTNHNFVVQKLDIDDKPNTE
jgi:ATP-dependent HslUV protease, peptidase subunit HslV